MEKLGAILDTRGKQLIIPAPGDHQVTLDLPPGATVLPLEKAPSGHLVLVTDAYAKVKTTQGGLPKRQIIFLANTHPKEQQPPVGDGQSSASSGLKVTVGANGTEPLSFLQLQAENSGLRTKIEDLEQQLQQLREKVGESSNTRDSPGSIYQGEAESRKEIDGSGSSSSMGNQQHAYRLRHGVSSPRQ